MFKAETLFIVGAGAGVDLLFPVGTELRSKIVGLVDVHFDSVGSPVRGDPELYRQVKSAFSPSSDTCSLAGRRIATGIFGKRSIDEYLDWSVADKVVVAYGKAAIVRAILNEEIRTKRSHFGNDTDFCLSHFQGRWHYELFQMLMQSQRGEHVRDIFRNVKFLIFNYDRCLEYFLYLALQQMGISEGEAREIISAEGTFFHAYGSIAPLFGAKAVSFGSINPHNFVALSRNIKTFTEVAEHADVTLPSTLMTSAQNVVFLGFSYNEQNMRLLTPGSAPVEKVIFGTTKGLPRPVAEDIENSLRRVKALNCNTIYLDDLSCLEFLKQYGNRICM